MAIDMSINKSDTGAEGTMAQWIGIAIAHELPSSLVRGYKHLQLQLQVI